MSMEVYPTGPELKDPYDVREYKLRDIPVDERKMADQRLVKKVTSGAEKITPHDLQYVSKDVFRNVINNFEPANKKTAQNPFVGGTFINHYHATHGRHPYGRDLGAEKQMERRFGTGATPIRNKNAMYKKIKRAQKITGMNRGGKVKKYAKGGGIRKAQTYG